MANPTSLNSTADLYPALTGWYENGPGIHSTITFAGLLLSGNPAHFPLQARIRLFNEGHLIAEDFSELIVRESFTTFSIEKALGSQKIRHGYMEVTVFSHTPQGLTHQYFNDVWGSIVHLDGSMELNFPLLITRGASPPMLDASHLYYPGIVHTSQACCRLVILNHHDFINHYDMKLFNAQGSLTGQADNQIPPKTLQILDLAETFNGLQESLAGQPGMLVFHYNYKLNAYIQTYHPQTGLTYGMDHVGLMFARDESTTKQTRKVPKALNAQGQRPLCYCKSLSLKELQAYHNLGAPLKTVVDQTGAGTICLGCVPDLENIFHERMPSLNHLTD